MADAETPIDEISGLKRERERERGFGGALVAEPPAASCALDQRVGVAHQRLQGGGGSGAPRQRIEDEHPLLVSQRDQRDSHPIVFSQSDFVDRLAEAGRRLSRLIGPKRAFHRLWMQIVLLSGLGDHVARLGIG